MNRGPATSKVSAPTTTLLLLVFVLFSPPLPPSSHPLPSLGAFCWSLCGVNRELKEKQKEVTEVEKEISEADSEDYRGWVSVQGGKT